MDRFHSTSAGGEAQASDGELREALRRAKLRRTAPRLAVLRAVRAVAGHPDVAEIAEIARSHLGRLSIQATYNILAALEAAGLLRRIEPPGSPARYEARVGDNHHHLVCRRCGTTVDVDCPVGAAPCLQPTAAYGFAIDVAEITFLGTCPACQAASAETG